MIFGSTAPTGGGKSYSSMLFLEEYLVSRPHDHICTNLAVEMDELVQHMIRRHGSDCECQQRLRILKEHEVMHFWRHFGVGFDIDVDDRVEWVDEDTGQKTIEVNYDRRGYLVDPKTGKRKGHSVLYLLDESDEIFDAKNWTRISSDLRFYVRHQRKFGDNVYFLTPTWGWLVKDIRVMCHSVWVWENKMQAKFGRIPVIGRYFRSGNGVVGYLWKCEDGKYGGLGQVPLDKKEFSIDPEGIGKCYRTEDGFGVKGIADRVRGAEKVKAFHPAWMIAIVLALAMLAMLLFEGVAKAIQNSIDKFAPKPAHAQNLKPIAAPAADLAHDRESRHADFVEQALKILEARKKDEVAKSQVDDKEKRLTGIIPKLGGFEFWWLDGSITTTGHREFERILWRGLPAKSPPCGVVWDGKEYRL